MRYKTSKLNIQRHSHSKKKKKHQYRQTVNGLLTAHSVVGAKTKSQKKSRKKNFNKFL